MHVVQRIGGDVQRVRSPERAAAVATTRGDDEHAGESVRRLVNHADSRHRLSTGALLAAGGNETNRPAAVSYFVLGFVSLINSLTSGKTHTQRSIK